MTKSRRQRRVYKSLKFTHQVYDHTENYQMEKAEANP